MPWSTYSCPNDVTLESSDGTVNIPGTFVDFCDNSYFVSTKIGAMRVSATRMDCFGAACPDVGAGAADIIAGGSDTVGLGLMPQWTCATSQTD
ncbi:MAG: hypothetical protein ACJASZ_002963 [Yoonia sp.]|jgi:hypothetical protein